MSDIPDSVVRTYTQSHGAARPENLVLADRPRVLSTRARWWRRAPVPRGAAQAIAKPAGTAVPVESRNTPGGPAVAEQVPGRV
jgi:hypothetical protein